MSLLALVPMSVRRMIALRLVPDILSAADTENIRLKAALYEAHKKNCRSVRILARIHDRLDFPSKTIDAADLRNTWEKAWAEIPEEGQASICLKVTEDEFPRLVAVRDGRQTIIARVDRPDVPTAKAFVNLMSCQANPQDLVADVSPSFRG